MMSDDKKKPSWWKGILGFVLLLVVLGGGAFALIRFENSQSIKDAQEQMGGEATSQAAQCYTPTDTMPFTTGNPRDDLTLSTIVKDHGDSQEFTEFLNTYRETGVLDTANPLWTEATKKTETVEDITVRVYLNMDIQGNLTAVEDDGKKYVPIVVETPTEGAEKQWDVAGISKVTNGEAGAVEQQIVVAVSGNTVVIPVENGENSDEQEYGLVSVSPIC